jgi:hypothetical protein
MNAAEQLTFDLSEIVVPDYAPDLTIAERFDAWHSANPWVYDALVSLVRDWLAAGHERVGIKQMFEVLRWSYGRSTVGDTFKCNNDFTSRYARLILMRHPEWAGAIEVRELRAA